MIRTETRFICDCGTVLSENALPLDYSDAKLALLAFALLHRNCQSNAPESWMAIPKNEVTGTEHDGICEACDALLIHDNLIEGRFGFYCSKECQMGAESGGTPICREDFHSDG